MCENRHRKIDESHRQIQSGSSAEIGLHRGIHRSRYFFYHKKTQIEEINNANDWFEQTAMVRVI